MESTKDTILTGAAAMWASVLAFVPKLVLFLAILVAGYFVSKWIAKLVGTILEKVGFDRLVERGGIKRALERTRYDASGIMCKIVFYALFLLVLELSFGVFGPNPISDILTRVIAFLPTLFVSLLIVVIAAAVAKAVKEMVFAILGGLSYGRALSNVAAAAVLVVGCFAALSHLGIAPAIVNGLFYAALAIVAGSAIVAIGGGGIGPMQRQWEKALNKVEQEAPKLRAQAQGAESRMKAQVEGWKERAESEVEKEGGPRFREEAPGVRYEPKERSRPS